MSGAPRQALQTRHPFAVRGCSESRGVPRGFSLTSISRAFMAEPETATLAVASLPSSDDLERACFVHPRALPARRGGRRDRARGRHAPPARARFGAGRARRGRGGALDPLAPPLVAAARPRPAAVPGRAVARRRHRAVGPPGRRAVRHADRAAGGVAAQRQRERARQRRRRRRRRAGRARLRGDPGRGGTARGAAGGRGLRRGAARLVGSGRGARGRPRRRPQRGQALLVRARDRRRQDGRRARLRRGVAHRRRPDPHPPPQPRRPVPRRAARPRLREADLARAAGRQGPGHRAGHGRDLPVVRPQRRQDLRRLHDRHLRRGAHRAGREDVGRDPRLDGPDLRRHDRDGRADRPPRHRPLPDADVALRPRPGRPPGRDRAPPLREDPAGAGRAHDRQGAAAPRRGGHRVRPGDAGRAAGPAAVQPRGGRPLQDALQRRPGRRLLGRCSPRLQRRRGVPQRRAEGAGGLGRDARSASWRGSSRPTSAATSTCSSTRSCSRRAGTRRARRSACTWRRRRRSASTSSASAA